MVVNFPNMAEKVRIYNFWSAFFSFLFFSTSNGDIFSQLPHLATTYAAVNALVTLGGDKALSSINRWCILFSLWSVSFIKSLVMFPLEYLHVTHSSFREKMSCFLRRMKDTSGGFRFDSLSA